MNHPIQPYEWLATISHPYGMKKIEPLNLETFILQHRNDDVRTLALRGAPEGVDLGVALQQIQGYQTALQKLPTWAQTEGILFPPHINMEQCSSEPTARYKSSLVEGTTLVDLTGGYGVDFAMMAPHFERALYVEAQPHLCDLARHNMPLLGCGHASILNTSCEAFLQHNTNYPEFPNSQIPPFPPGSVAYIDPSRRDTAGRKVALIQDCTPDICRLQHLIRERFDRCLIKLSPMLDITAATTALEGIGEVHIVGVQGECKELLLVMRGREEHNNTSTPCTIHCVDLPRHATPFIFTREEERDCTVDYATDIRRDDWLYQPHASILKGGAFRCVAHRYGLQKVAPMSHLYIGQTDAGRDEFPGTCHRVEDVSTFGKKELKAFLRDIPAADITTRGFPLTAEQLRQQLRLRQDTRIHLFATTLSSGQRILIRTSLAQKNT